MKSQGMQALRSEQQESGTSRLFDTLSSELSNIAEEIEKFPIVLGHDYSHQEIELLQSIDFCGQKLKDIARILGLISNQTGDIAVDRDSLEQSVKIEAIRSLVL